MPARFDRPSFSHLALINAVMHVIRADEALARNEPLLATPAVATIGEQAG